MCAESRAWGNGSHSNTVVFCDWLPVSSICCHSIRTPLILQLLSPFSHYTESSLHDKLQRSIYMRASFGPEPLLQLFGKLSDLLRHPRRWFMNYAEIYKERTLERSLYISQIKPHSGNLWIFRYQRHDSSPKRVSSGILLCLS